jgi:YegS/Rv2252/BmrU family lipid kinase
LTIGVVMNPRAGGGRMTAEWPALAHAIQERLGAFQLATTTRAGEASALAERLADEGVGLIIAAGGDGTIGEVADGILRSRLRPELGIIPIGTGADFPRNITLGATSLEAVETIASGRRRVIDAGQVHYIGDDGKPAKKHFINVASLGLSGPTVRAVNGAKARGRSGKLTFLYHTLTQMLGYRGQSVRVRIDGEEQIDERIVVVAIGNGRYFGAGLMVAPDAELSDGLLDVVIVKMASKLSMIRVLSKAYDGGHKGSPLCTFRKAKVVTMAPLSEGDEVLIDIDGESPGRAPMRVEVLPGALTLRA